MRQQEAIRYARSRIITEKCDKDDQEVINCALELYNFMSNETLNYDFRQMTLNDICAYLLDRQMWRKEYVEEAEKDYKKSKEKDED